MAFTTRPLAGASSSFGTTSFRPQERLGFVGSSRVDVLAASGFSSAHSGNDSASANKQPATDNGPSTANTGNDWTAHDILFPNPTFTYAGSAAAVNDPIASRGVLRVTKAPLSPSRLRSSSSSKKSTTTLSKKGSSLAGGFFVAPVVKKKKTNPCSKVLRLLQDCQFA